MLLLPHLRGQLMHTKDKLQWCVESPHSPHITCVSHLQTRVRS